MRSSYNKKIKELKDRKKIDLKKININAEKLKKLIGDGKRKVGDLRPDKKNHLNSFSGKKEENEELYFQLEKPLPLNKRRRLNRNRPDEENPDLTGKKTDQRKQEKNTVLNKDKDIEKSENTEDKENENIRNKETTRLLESQKDTILLRLKKWIKEKFNQEKNLKTDFRLQERIVFKIKRMTLTQWILLFAMSLMILFFIVGGVQSLSYGLTIDEVIPVFSKAMEEGDTERLKAIIKSNKNEKPLSENEILPLTRLYNENLEYRELLNKKLKEDKGKIEKGQQAEDEFAYIVENKDINPFSKKYRISFKKITAQAADEEFNLLVSGERIKLSKEGTDILPGIYEARKNINILQLSKAVQIDHINIRDGILRIGFDPKNAKIINGEYSILPGEKEVIIEDASPDDIVFINRKNTNMTVSEFNSFGKKNINEGDELSLMNQEPWGYSFSDTLKIGPDSKYGLQIEMINQEVVSGVQDLIVETLKKDREAFMTSDVERITTLTGTAYLKNLSLLRMNNIYGQGYIKNYERLLLDMDTFELDKKEGYKGYVGGYLTGSEVAFRLEEGPESAKNFVQKEKEKVGFHFVYNKKNQKWMINQWGSTNKEFKNENLIEIPLNK